MTVRDLIAHLSQFDPDLPVCYYYYCYSEQRLLEAEEIKLQQFGPARADGWVPCNRDDKTAVTYVTFPGN